MWKLKPEAEGRTAQENALWMKEHLEGLMGVVPQLLECEVGINVALEDLAAYKVHPAHVEISAYCNKVRESRVACDFEVKI